MATPSETPRPKSIICGSIGLGALVACATVLAYLPALPGGFIWNDSDYVTAPALRLQPDFAEAHNNLGSALLGMPGRLNDAITQYEEALRLRPDFAEAHYDLGLALAKMPSRLNDAVAQFEEALRLRPDFAEAHYDLGSAWLRIPGRLKDAVAQFEEALHLKPNDPAARQALAEALKQAREN